MDSVHFEKKPRIKTLKGKRFAQKPHDRGQVDEKHGIHRESVKGEALLKSISSSNITFEIDIVDHVITDPPYAGNVNYSELADFFFVWLGLVLSHDYEEFATEFTPKAEEIVENPTRGKSSKDFESGLTEVFKECFTSTDENSILSFTFHHAEGKSWEALLRAICNSGFVIESVYPIHSESEISLHLMNKKAISYDLIHVCRKRPNNSKLKTQNSKLMTRSWAGIRQEIRKRAREEIRLIEDGRYGKEPLSPADVNLVLIGKCLELYSRHYGAVIDHEGKEVPLHEALKEIKNLVDALVAKDRPLPSELEEIDPESRIYLLNLCRVKEIKSDDVSKATRGIMEPDDLLDAGLMIKGRAGRRRTYEIKRPSERFDALNEKFRKTAPSQSNLFGESEGLKTRKKVYFIDYVHYLVALVEAGENVVPWLERFRGETPRIRAACEYLRERNVRFAPTLGKILELIDIGPLFK